LIVVTVYVASTVFITIDFVSTFVEVFAVVSLTTTAVDTDDIVVDVLKQVFFYCKSKTPNSISQEVGLACL
jgi:hypothetical protein